MVGTLGQDLRLQRLELEVGTWNFESVSALLVGTRQLICSQSPIMRARAPTLANHRLLQQALEAYVWKSQSKLEILNGPIHLEKVYNFEKYLGISNSF